MSPGDFTTLRNKIESSPVLSDQEKSEWLVMLPHMTAEHIKELDRILAIREPSTQERKNQKTEEPKTLRAREPASSPPTIHHLPSTFRPPVGTIISTKPRVVNAVESNAADVEEFKELTVEKMREAGSVYTFLEALTKKMSEVKHKKGIGTDALIAAFEQSPLYRVYLESGLRIMGKGDSALTRSEFEAIADYRETLRKNLN